MKVVVLEADEGGFRGEVPALPGCGPQGETLEEPMTSLGEAIEGCLSVDVSAPTRGSNGRVIEVAV